MKITINLLVLFSFLVTTTLFGQVDATVDKGNGVHYFSGIPGTTPNIETGSEFAINALDRQLWQWNRTGNIWEMAGKVKHAAGVPVTAPDATYTGYIDTDTGQPYQYRGISIGWQPIGDVSVSNLSSPSLTEVEGIFKLDYSDATEADITNITNAIAASQTSLQKIKDSLLLEISDGLNILKYQGRLTFFNSQTALRTVLGGDSTNMTLITLLSMYNLDPLQIDSLIQRVVNEPIALTRLGDALGIGDTINYFDYFGSGIIRIGTGKRNWNLLLNQIPLSDFIDNLGHQDNDLTENFIWVGNNLGKAIGVMVSGEISHNGNGNFTINENTIDSSKIEDGTITDDDLKEDYLKRGEIAGELGPCDQLFYAPSNTLTKGDAVYYRNGQILAAHNTVSGDSLATWIVVEKSTDSVRLAKCGIWAIDHGAPPNTILYSGVNFATIDGDVTEWNNPLYRTISTDSIDLLVGYRPYKNREFAETCDLLEKRDSIVINPIDTVIYNFIINAKCEYDTVLTHKKGIALYFSSRWIDDRIIDTCYIWHLQDSIVNNVVMGTDTLFEMVQICADADTTATQDIVIICELAAKSDSIVIEETDTIIYNFVIDAVNCKYDTVINHRSVHVIDSLCTIQSTDSLINHTTLATNFSEDLEVYNINGQDYAISVMRNGGVGFVYSIDAATGLYTEIDQITTIVAFDTKVYNIGADYYAVVANLVGDSKLYDIDETTGLYTQIQTLPTRSARDWEAYEIDGKWYAVAAHSTTVTSYLYDIDETTGIYSLIQSVTTSESNSWEVYTVGGTNYAFRSDAVGDSDLWTIDGVTGLYTQIQTLPTSNSNDAEYMKLGNKHYLLVANTSASDELYEINETTGQLTAFLTLPITSTFDLEYFFLNNRHFLVSATVQGADLHELTVISDTQIDFSDIRELTTVQAENARYYTVNDTSYLYIGQVPAGTSPVFKFYEEEVCVDVLLRDRVLANTDSIIAIKLRLDSTELAITALESSASTVTIASSDNSIQVVTDGTTGAIDLVSSVTGTDCSLVLDGTYPSHIWKNGDTTFHVSSNCLVEAEINGSVIKYDNTFAPSAPVPAIVDQTTFGYVIDTTVAQTFILDTFGTVGVNGVDFTNIYTAIGAIGDGTDGAWNELKIMNGRYEYESYLNTATRLPAYLKIIGENRDSTIIFSYDPAYLREREIFMIQDSYIFEDLTFEVEGSKYANHLGFQNTTGLYGLSKNVTYRRMEYASAGSGLTVGMDLKSNYHISYENCSFEDVGGNDTSIAFNMHTVGSNTAISSVSFKDCEFKRTGVGIFSDYGSGEKLYLNFENVTSDAHVIFELINAPESSIIVSQENFDVDEYEFRGIKPSIFYNNADFYRLGKNTTTGLITAGTPLRRDYSQNQLSFDVAAIKVDYVALEDIPAGELGYVSLRDKVVKVNTIALSSTYTKGDYLKMTGVLFEKTVNEIGAVAVAMETKTIAGGKLKVRLLD